MCVCSYFQSGNSNKTKSQNHIESDRNASNVQIGENENFQRNEMQQIQFDTKFERINFKILKMEKLATGRKREER